MTAMNLRVNDEVHLTEFRPADKAALVEWLSDRDIYERTLRIPYPYSEADADAWLSRILPTADRPGRPGNWAVREAGGRLIGGIGLDGLGDAEPWRAHRAEIGYWLAKPFWGRGIMTAVVRAVCAHGFAECGLVKITAQVFDGNAASARVLEKNGFVQEGCLRKHVLKDGRYLDVRAYARVR
jgi:[ribosomal protein S5]-alanine N-acetyltransferase